MKRLVTHGRHPQANGELQALAKEAAVQLLERSIQFGHGRLSVLRLAMAVQSGADIPYKHWDFCHRVASASKDLGTQALFLKSAQSALNAPELFRAAP